MGRAMTLRGSIDTVWNDTRATEALIFNYESPDRTRGWRVTGAWVWIDTLSQNTISSNNNPGVIAALATDTIIPAGAPGVSMNAITTASDNRLFGWTQIHYRGFDTSDYYIPHASIPESNRFLLDFDRIVTNELYMNVQCITNGGLPAGINPVKVNYLISLEEMTLSPSQSVLQQLKGIGQDVVN